MQERVTFSLNSEHKIEHFRLRKDLCFEGQDFEKLWKRHPLERPLIKMVGREVRVPRYQQAYGRDYVFSGMRSHAIDIPPFLAPLLAWAKDEVAREINGLLVNWYDAKEGHYIGAHRDSAQGLVRGAPICIVSFGETRALRFRPFKGKGFNDLLLPSGSGVVLPYATNRAFTHEVPRKKSDGGRRVSVTLRAFVG